MSGRTRRVLKVFLGSPGDLTEERRAAFAAVRRVNAITGRHLGWEIDLRGWEDTLPEYGRPQAIINQDVDEADVFIGMLWRRWGQETGEYSSGFEEEFERAMARRRRTAAPEIAMFFKSLTPDERVDPGDHLSRVLAFKKGLVEDRSILFREFESTGEWANLVFEFLMTQVVNQARPVEVGAPLLTIAPVKVDAVLASRTSTPDPLSVVFSTQTHTDQQTETITPDLTLAKVGSIGLVGPPGSGKSVGLTTIAVTHALATSPRELEIRVWEPAGSALSTLRSLPHCVSYTGPDDLVTLVPTLQALEDEMRTRWGLFAEVDARDRDHYARLTGLPLPRLLLVIDGIHHADRFDRPVHRLLAGIISAGRAAGLFVACSAPSKAQLSIGTEPQPVGRIVRLGRTQPVEPGVFVDEESQSRTILYLDPAVRELAARLQAQHGPPVVSRNLELAPFYLDEGLLAEASLTALPIGREIGSNVVATVSLSPSTPVCIIGGTTDEQLPVLAALRHAIFATGIPLDVFELDRLADDQSEAARLDDWLSASFGRRRLVILPDLRDQGAWYRVFQSLEKAPNDLMFVICTRGRSYGWSQTGVPLGRGTFLVISPTRTEQSFLMGFDIPGPPILGPSGAGVGWVVDSSRARPVVLAGED